MAQMCTREDTHAHLFKGAILNDVIVRMSSQQLAVINDCDAWPKISSWRCEKGPLTK